MAQRKAAVMSFLAGIPEAFRALRPGFRCVKVGRVKVLTWNVKWWAPWRNLRQRNIGWRLDYVLANEHLARSARGCPVLREFGTSDHGPVVATFTD
jgi:hypothetical protein